MSENLNQEIIEYRENHAESAEKLKRGHEVLYAAGIALAQARLAFDTEKDIRLPRDDIWRKAAAYRSLGTSHIEDHEAYTGDIADAQDHFERNQTAYIEHAKALMEETGIPYDDGSHPYDKIYPENLTPNRRTEITPEEPEEEQEEG